MNISIEESTQKVMVVTPTGRVDAYHAPAFRGAVYEVIEEGNYKIVVDLSGVNFMDSAGMSVLVTLLKRVKQNQGDVKLVRPKNPAAQRILTLTRFDRVFDMSDSAESAVQKFF